MDDQITFFEWVDAWGLTATHGEWNIMFAIALGLFWWGMVKW